MNKAPDSVNIGDYTTTYRANFRDNNIIPTHWFYEDLHKFSQTRYILSQSSKFVRSPILDFPISLHEFPVIVDLFSGNGMDMSFFYKSLSGKKHIFGIDMYLKNNEYIPLYNRDKQHTYYTISKDVIEGLTQVLETHSKSRKFLLLKGGTIGNMDTPSSKKLLQTIGEMLNVGDILYLDFFHTRNPSMQNVIDFNERVTLTEEIYNKMNYGPFIHDCLVRYCGNGGLHSTIRSGYKHESHDCELSIEYHTQTERKDYNLNTHHLYCKGIENLIKDKPNYSASELYETFCSTNYKSIIKPANTPLLINTSHRFDLSEMHVIGNAFGGKILNHISNILMSGIIIEKI